MGSSTLRGQNGWTAKGEESSSPNADRCEGMIGGEITLPQACEINVLPIRRVRFLFEMGRRPDLSPSWHVRERKAGTALGRLDFRICRCPI